MLLKIVRCTLCRKQRSSMDGVAVCPRCGILIVDGQFDCYLTPTQCRIVAFVAHRSGYAVRTELTDYVYPDPNEMPDSFAITIRKNCVFIGAKSQRIKILKDGPGYGKLKIVRRKDA